MAYRITGLAPEPFAGLARLDDAALAAKGAMRITALGGLAYPCRISLEDATPGETLFLVHHVSHNVATPYRSAYAIYVRAAAGLPATFHNCTPPVFDGRPIALRGFGADAMLKAAALALPGQADAKIRSLFEQADIAYIHAHNAAHGCFSARIDRE